MNDILTYQELENQIAELKKQNEILILHSSLQKEGEIEFPVNSSSSYAGISKLWNFESKKNFNFKEDDQETMNGP